MINTSLSKQLKSTFAQAIADLKDDEVPVFLHDFFSEIELETFAKRLAISYWLRKGRSYQNIAVNLKVSEATIAKVAQQAKKKGFALGIKKIEAQEWANKWAKRLKIV